MEEQSEAQALSEKMKLAAELSESPAMTNAFHTAIRDSSVWEEARSNPREYLRSQGVQLPEELEVAFFQGPGSLMPADDVSRGTHYILKPTSGALIPLILCRRTNCRRCVTWRADEGGYSYLNEDERCFGFDIFFLLRGRIY